MRYLEAMIPTTPRQLQEDLTNMMLRASDRWFPEQNGPDFDGAFYCMERGVENLRKRFGDAKADQLLDMIRQAKAHHEEGWRLTGGAPPPADKPQWWESKDAPTEMPGWWQQRLGNALLQDVEMVVANRKPWAYPRELYRWPVNPWHPEQTAEDLLNRDEEE